MSRSIAILTSFMAAAFLLAACEVEQVSPDENADGRDTVIAEAAFRADVVSERVESEDATFQIVRVASGLERPWGLEFLPDGRMLVTERPGRMSIVDGGDVAPLSGLPEIGPVGQGGLLDVRLHPDYETNGWIYFAYSDPGDGGVGTAIARARLDGTELTDLETLYSMEPKTGAGAHFGSRILFLGDGTFLFTIGDRGQPDRAQDTMDPAGSTLRLTDDGNIPEDNPFVGQDGYLPELYTVGNRNSQGMAIHPGTGAVWQTEHGPRGGDELNLIRAGENYGWPEATWGRDYRTRAQIGVTPDEAPQFVAPVTHWTPAIAPSGTTFYTGDQFPGWRGSLFVGSLSREALIRVVLDGEEVQRYEQLLDGQIGRIRYVTQGPDGYLYLLQDDPDGGIYRLEPAE